MKRVLDILRIILISPELLWVLIIFVMYNFIGDSLSLLGNQFKTNSDIWKTLYILPFIFTGFAFKIAGRLRSPLQKEENKILYEWPQYHMITDRVLVSLFLCIISCIIVASIWVISDRINATLIAAVYLIFLGVSGISTLMMILSEHKLKEILTRNT